MDDSSAKNQPEAERRRDQLAGEMESAIDRDQSAARQQERKLSWIFNAAMAVTILAVLLTASSPAWLPRGVIAAITVLPGTLFAWKEKVDHRTTANLFYERRDRLTRLRQQLLYQGPHPITLDYVTFISEQLAFANEEVGRKMAATHARRGS